MEERYGLLLCSRLQSSLCTEESSYCADLRKTVEITEESSYCADLRKTVEIQTFCYHGHACHTSPLYLISFKIPTKATPLRDSHILGYHDTLTVSCLLC